MVNVGKYIGKYVIHGSHGMDRPHCFSETVIAVRCGVFSKKNPACHFACASSYSSIVQWNMIYPKWGTVPVHEPFLSEELQYISY